MPGAGSSGDYFPGRPRLYIVRPPNPVRGERPLPATAKSSRMELHRGIVIGLLASAVLWTGIVLAAWAVLS